MRINRLIIFVSVVVLVVLVLVVVLLKDCSNRKRKEDDFCMYIFNKERKRGKETKEMKSQTTIHGE